MSGEIDRIKGQMFEELAESLSAPQEEAIRLRNRLLVLEYEGDYIGPSSLFSESDVHTNQSSAEEDDNNSDPSTMVTIDYGPMTVVAHKRRSGDFKILEQKARSFEAQIRGLKKDGGAGTRGSSKGARGIPDGAT
ncbi:hypothetical protein BGX34_004557 [Mortierella sp. NVP85]|nr:hypothetical protein BGX34_004557 [Mortierella sp. NVP85]